ncbi:hypothetical protein HYU23_03880 [Candidatus Woesearchaeota archaeon]|nr:hypothetical protein [Candidatus Woesearchaeota archaeon]
MAEGLYQMIKGRLGFVLATGLVALALSGCGNDKKPTTAFYAKSSTASVTVYEVVGGQEILEVKDYKGRPVAYYKVDAAGALVPIRDTTRIAAQIDLNNPGAVVLR